MRTYKYYEPLSKSAAVFTALLSAVFYYLSTEDATLKEKLSGIIVNIFINYFMAKNSIDVESRLIDDKKIAQAIAYPVFAALLYTPQTIIAYRDGEASNKAFAFSSALATMLSGSTLNMNSLKGLVDFTQRDIIPAFQSATPLDWKTRKTLLCHLEILLERVRFSNYKEAPLFELALMLNPNETMPNAAVRIALFLAESTKKIAYPTPSFPRKIAKLAPQLMVATIMVLGSLGYDCGVEAALRTYFFSETKEAATAFALLLMSCLFILNIKAAFMLVSTIINMTGAIINYGRLPNDCYLGGARLKALTCSSPFIALMLTSFSGFTATNLYNTHCASSQLRFLRFPHANDVIDYSTRTFNGTYAELSIIEAEKNYIRHADSDVKDRTYLAIIDALESLLDTVKRTKADQLAQLLDDLGPDCQQLTDPLLFKNSVESDLESARLLSA